MRLWVRSLALLSGLRIQRGCEVWRRPAATAPIGPLAWELPDCAGIALEKTKGKKKKKKSKSVYCTLEFYIISYIDSTSTFKSVFLKNEAVALGDPFP